MQKNLHGRKALINMFKSKSESQAKEEDGWVLIISFRSSYCMQQAYLSVNGWNSDHFNIKHSSMVVHPLHSWERNLQYNGT